MNDGMASTQILATQFSGTTLEATNISGASVDAAVLAAGASEIGATEIAGGAVTSSKILSGNVLAVHISGQQVQSQHHAVIGTGSPTVYGNIVKFGTAALGAGSNAWVVFGTAFKAAPVVVVSHNDGATTGIWVASGTAGAGSVQIEGATASKAFNWIACGSG